MKNMKVKKKLLVSLGIVVLLSIAIAVGGIVGMSELNGQIVSMNVTADKHEEATGTTVETTGNGNLQTRVGVKVWAQPKAAVGVKPFVEANWIHNTRQMGVRMNGVDVMQAGADNQFQMKAGLEASFTKNLQAWGNVTVSTGSNAYREHAASVGVRYTF